MPDSSKPRLMSRIAGAVALLASALMPGSAPAQVNVADIRPHVGRSGISAGLLHEARPPVALPPWEQPEARLDSDGVTLIVRARWSRVFLYGVAQEAVCVASPLQACAVPLTEPSFGAASPPATSDHIGTAEGETRGRDAPLLVDPALAAEADLEAAANEPRPSGTQLPAVPEDPAFWAPTGDGQPRFGPATEEERREALCQAVAWAVEDRPHCHPFGYLAWDESRLYRGLHLLRDVLRGRPSGKTWELARSPIRIPANAQEASEIQAEIAEIAEVATISTTFWALPPQHRIVVLCTALKAGFVADIPQREIAVHIAVSERTMAVARQQGKPSCSHATQRWVSRLKRDSIERAGAAYAARLAHSSAELPAA